MKSGIVVDLVQAHYSRSEDDFRRIVDGLIDDEFTKNYRALRDQLARLGLLQSLSDYCDFVKNPFFHGND